MRVKLLTEQDLEFLSFKGDCTGSSESTLVKMPHCWKARVTAQFFSDVYERMDHGFHPYLNQKKQGKFDEFIFPRRRVI